jgi:hypothetical protein
MVNVFECWNDRIDLSGRTLRGSAIAALAALPFLPLSVMAAPAEVDPMPIPSELINPIQTVAQLPENQLPAATLLAQSPAGPSTSGAGSTEPIPTSEEIDQLRVRLQSVQDAQYEQDDLGKGLPGSPGITIGNPSGFGADDNTFFFGGGFQARTRFDNKEDGGLVMGVGLGNASEVAGAELSYSLVSIGGSRDFGAGGFNAKIHRQFAPGSSGAVGWNGLVTTGAVDFDDSLYAVATHIFRTRPNLNQPFSRIALTGGLGNGQFRTERQIEDDVAIVNPFSSIAVRLAEPVSAILEWTGQDLAAGLSITPFPRLKWAITPGVRDITGAGDGARFVLGTGFSLKF